jgi:hypothetical protein
MLVAPDAVIRRFVGALFAHAAAVIGGLLLRAGVPEDAHAEEEPVEAAAREAA